METTYEIREVQTGDYLDLVTALDLVTYIFAYE